MASYRNSQLGDFQHCAPGISVDYLPSHLRGRERKKRGEILHAGKSAENRAFCSSGFSAPSNTTEAYALSPISQPRIYSRTRGVRLGRKSLLCGLYQPCSGPRTAHSIIALRCHLRGKFEDYWEC